MTGLRPSVVFAMCGALAACGNSSPSGPEVGSACNTLVNDAPHVMPACPTTGAASGCTTCPALGSGGPIADGTYDLVEDVVFLSACGALQPIWGVLKIAAPTMEYVET